MNQINNDYDRIHLAIMALESAAQKMHISGAEVYNRMKAHNLVHNYLLQYYEELHSQSTQWLANTTVETLSNWEA